MYIDVEKELSKILSEELEKEGAKAICLEIDKKILDDIMSTYGVDENGIKVKLEKKNNYTKFKKFLKNK